MAYDTFPSSSPSLGLMVLLMAIIIWSLVFHFIVFRVFLTFVKAVVLILRHAAVLRLSNSSSLSALTNVELAYREANIDSKIQQHLMASSEEHSVELSAAFIMATDIGELFLHLLR